MKRINECGENIIFSRWYVWRRLLLLSLLTAITVVCNAQFPGGSGTAADPWQIATAQQLDNVRNRQGYFIQIADIDLGVAPYNEGEGWVPLPSRNFDGNGFTIHNLTINSTAYRTGLFIMNNVTLQNINLENVSIDVTNSSNILNVGALAGYSSSSAASIINCHVSGTIQGSSTRRDYELFGVGGLVGVNYNNALIINCSSRGSVFGSGENGIKVGGLVGYNQCGLILNSFSLSNVVGEGNSYGRVGGVGGFVGFNLTGNIISNCYARGNVKGDDITTGGFVGHTVQIANCYSTGIIVDAGSGFAGSYGIPTNSYWDMDTSRKTYSVGGEGRTTEEMTYPYDGNTYTDWEFGEIWCADDTGEINDGYPYLYWQVKYETPNIATNPIPYDKQRNISVELDTLYWSYESRCGYPKPVGFKVYLNSTGEFDENDEFAWVEYIEGEEDFFCTEILPERLEGMTVYYWKVVPTTGEPDGIGDTKNPLTWSFATGINTFPTVTVNPLPADDTIDITIYLSSLQWEYVVDSAYVKPSGFKVYMNRSGEFDENDEFEWVEYIEGEEDYFCSDILPERLEGMATYYWKVVPTTGEPDNRGDAQNVPIWSFITGINPFPAVTVNPLPADDTNGVIVNLSSLQWRYVVDSAYVKPSGFRVYMKRTGIFFVNDEFKWVEYIEGEEDYFCSDILPERLEGMTTYYWKVVPTTGRPGNLGDAKNVPIWSFKTEIDTGREENLVQPYNTALVGNFPNPFNPETAIVFTLQEPQFITLKIFNSKGRLIRTLTEEVCSEGKHSLIWDGKNQDNQQVSSGIYFYRMETSSYVETKKMLLLR